MNPIRRFAEKMLLLASRSVPTRYAAHFLHLLRQNPALTDRWGYHIRPIHYYDPVPDFRTITAERLMRRRVPKGVTIDVQGQARRLEGLANRFGEEIRAVDASGRFPFDNEYFAGLDAAL